MFEKYEKTGSIPYSVEIEMVEGDLKLTADFNVYRSDIPEIITCLDPDICIDEEWDRLLEFLVAEIVDNGIMEEFNQSLLEYYPPGDHKIDIGFELRRGD